LAWKSLINRASWIYNKAAEKASKDLANIWFEKIGLKTSNYLMRIFAHCSTGYYLFLM
jgi:hypothetical protein